MANSGKTMSCSRIRPPVKDLVGTCVEISLRIAVLKASVKQVITFSVERATFENILVKKMLGTFLPESKNCVHA